MLKGIRDFFIFYFFAIALCYGFMCIGMHGAVTSTILDCTRSSDHPEPSCRLTENYYLGLSQEIKTFQGITQARFLFHQESGKHGPYVVYDVALDDGQGKGFMIQHADGGENAKAYVEQINAFRANPALLSLYIVNDRMAWIVLAFVVGVPTLLSILVLIQAIWRWIVKPKTQSNYRDEV